MKQENIENGLDDIFDNISEEEKLQFEAIIINEALTSVIKDLMKQNNIKSRAELAAKLEVKPPFITNLFRGEKHYNITLLAKLQRVFNTSFTFNAKSLQSSVSPVTSKAQMFYIKDLPLHTITEDNIVFRRKRDAVKTQKTKLEYSDYSVPA